MNLIMDQPENKTMNDVDQKDDPYDCHCCEDCCEGCEDVCVGCDHQDKDQD